MSDSAKQEKDVLDAYARRTVKDAALLKIAALVRDSLETDANNSFLVKKFFLVLGAAALLLAGFAFLFPAAAQAALRLLSMTFR